MMGQEAGVCQLPDAGGTRMKLLGMTVLSSNHRITIPPRAIEALKMKEGDMLVFHEDGGRLIISVEK
jgi:bifunctional DNA-binding transcriptional regulator/antitoxin component of YhaV-PrlF toxin-antitoxin module